MPDGRTDACLSAIDAGLWVAGYKAGDQVDAIKPLFDIAGAQQVEIF